MIKRDFVFICYFYFKIGNFLWMILDFKVFQVNGFCLGGVCIYWRIVSYVEDNVQDLESVECQCFIQGKDLQVVDCECIFVWCY